MFDFRNSSEQLFANMILAIAQISLPGIQTSTIAILILGFVLTFLFVQFVHLSCALVSTEKETDQGGYYAKSAADREQFRAKLRLHRRLLAPILWLIRTSNQFSFERLTFQYKGVSGPIGTCSIDAFRNASEYQPQTEDIFVVSQMKCGTTWLQHLVYEILHRGEGTLAETGTTLYSVSPWLESTKTIPVEDAPLIGKTSRRLIKTHLPVEICPRNTSAKYIYITRNPVSCFASCRDFVLSNLGERQANAISDSVFESWFCSSEKMWWTDWPNHVDGWWKESIENDNVIFIRFEDLKEDLRQVTIDLAKFLGIDPLDQTEIENVLRKSSFEYMKEHAELFEMYPPHLLQESAKMFVSGKSARSKDVDPELSSRITAWCRDQCKEFPLERMYGEQLPRPN